MAKRKQQKKAAPKKAALAPKAKVAPKKVVTKKALAPDKKNSASGGGKKSVNKPVRKALSLLTTSNITIPDSGLYSTLLEIIPPNGSTPAVLGVWNVKSFNSSADTINGQTAEFDTSNTITIVRDSTNTKTIVSATTVTTYSGTSAAPTPAVFDTSSIGDATVFLITVNGYLCWNTATNKNNNQICPMANILYINQGSGSPYIAIGYVYNNQV